MNTPTDSSRVYNELFRLAQPGADPTNPERTLRSPGYCRGFASTQAILRTLLEKFSHAELQRAGVLQPRFEPPRTIRLFLHPDLASPQRTWIAVQDEDGTVHDIVGQTGCISGNTIPLLAIRDDKLVRRHVLHFKSIFVTFSVEDAAVLRALGLPAITATGLAGLERRQENQYRKLLLDGLDGPAESSVGGCTDCSESTNDSAESSVGERTECSESTNDSAEPSVGERTECSESTNDSAEPSVGECTECSESTKEVSALSARKALRDRWCDEFSRCSLVLVGWSPAIPSAAEPNQLANTMHRLGEIHEDRPESLSVWRQTDGSLEPLLRTVQLRRSQPIRDALETSIKENCKPAIPEPPPLPELPLAVLYDKLQHYLKIQYPPGLNEVRDQILRRYKKLLIDPLRLEAETTSDFRTAFFQLELADLVERQRTVALENTIAPTPTMRISSALVDRRISEQFKLTDRIFKLTEALCKSRRRNSTLGPLRDCS